jgi:6-phosphogluconolactonase
MPQQNLMAYIGTYTRREARVLGGNSEGIYVYRFDPATGGLDYSSKIAGVDNPSFLALHPQGRYLYAVNEVDDFGGQPTGAVSSFAVDPASGGLTFLNQQPSHGTAPCHMSVDRAGKFVLVSNYSSGSVAVLPILEDGRLGPASDVVQHHGSSVNPERQQGPHAHSITLDPANRYAFVADLGLDKVMAYRFDLDAGKLQAAAQPWAQVTAGAGPRHFAFHPSRRYAYLINEIGSTMTAFAYDEAAGALAELQTLSTLPAGFSGRSHCADVHVAPSGKFVYGSNRGHDSIIIFAVDEATGKLSVVDYEPTQGQTPRNFAIDPTGAFLLAANQNSDTIVVFRIDPATGRLTSTGHVANVPVPVCIEIWTNIST